MAASLPQHLLENYENITFLWYLNVCILYWVRGSTFTLRHLRHGFKLYLLSKKILILTLIKYAKFIEYTWQQTSASYSSADHYSKITENSAFIWGQLLGQIFMNRVNMIRVFHYRALTWLRYQSFHNRLENEPRVETLIHWSLLGSK